MTKTTHRYEIQDAEGNVVRKIKIAASYESTADRIAHRWMEENGYSFSTGHGLVKN